MPRSGNPLFTTKWPNKYQIRDRIIRRRDNKYYIVTAIVEVFEDGNSVYTIYGYLDPNQNDDQEE